MRPGRRKPNCNSTSATTPGLQDSFVGDLVAAVGLLENLDDLNRRHLEIAVRATKLACVEGDPHDSTSINSALTLEWNRLELPVLGAERSVKLMSIHQAKGLEFNCVYLARLEEGLIPLSLTDNISEERRVLFVGITRAINHPVLSWSNTNDSGRTSSRSRFLDEIPLDKFDLLT